MVDRAASTENFSALVVSNVESWKRWRLNLLIERHTQRDHGPKEASPLFLAE
jgi:hypothetical protein